MLQQKRICYVMPYTENFREERPRLCWEFIYGWMDGYGVCFDPVIQKKGNAVPIFSNGAPEKISEDIFYITSSREATREFHPENVAGLFLSPETDAEFRPSMKERIKTPVGTYFYPVKFPVSSLEGNDPEWLMGEKSVLKRNGNQSELYFELFSMTGFQVQEFPHKRLLIAGDILAEILGCSQDDFDHTREAEEFRLDCQSFGISRLFMQWLLKLLKEDPEQVSEADSDYRQAVRFYAEKDLVQAVSSLRNAFRKLYELRIKYISLDFQIAEFPHAGILFPESGFFELEWPEGTRNVMEAHLNDVERNNYVASFELSGSDWNELKKKFPKMIHRIETLWKAGKIDLTNGTWGLPYAFVSPVNLQYFQFLCGLEAFRSTFGKTPELYECQENSFTPQMPELLVHFGYKKVLHSAQNHGTPCYETDPQIRWTSPSGLNLSALTASGPEQVKLGINFFLDLPLQLMKHRDKKSFYAFNMMDLGYIPFRESMIRATRYAPIFGRFILGTTLFSEPEGTPSRTYSSDDYNFSADAFYRNYTNQNALSHFEHLFRLTSEWRTLQMLSGKAIPEEKEIARLLCSYEAHDCDRVQGQRPGEFYWSRINEPSPTSRLKLADLLADMRNKLRTIFDSVYSKTTSQPTELLFNSSEVPLSFAEVKHPELAQSDLFQFSGRIYAAGMFAPLRAGKSQDITGPTETSSEKGIIGDWEISAYGNRIKVRKGEKCSVFTPIDSLQGDFQLQSAEYRKNGKWLTAKLLFLHTGPRMESLMMEGITTEDSDYIEWNLRYAGQEHFDEANRWKDFLALSFECDESVKLRNFVPSMMCETKEKRIISSYCMDLEDKYSLLFNGAGNFQRDNRTLNWLFHVANETVYERKLILSFGESAPALLSRGLFSGLIPAAELPENLPGITGKNISIECKIAENKWLITNLSGQDNSFDLPETHVLESMAGEQISDGKLGPFQMAILTVNK